MGQVLKTCAFNHCYFSSDKKDLCWVFFWKNLSVIECAFKVKKIMLKFHLSMILLSYTFSKKKGGGFLCGQQLFTMTMFNL